MHGQIDELDFKTLFSSFELHQEEEKIDINHHIAFLSEEQKGINKMFIFANVFILLNKNLIKSQNDSI